MKVWLNDLKKGDIFYYPSPLLNEILKCKHLGDANNTNFLMSRIKYEILENPLYKEAIDNYNEDNELFVNQYVYDDYDSAFDALINTVTKTLEDVEQKIKTYQAKIGILKIQKDILEKFLNENSNNNKSNSD